MDKNNFGAIIYKVRKENGWNQKELAEKLHTSDKAVSRWETGSSLPDIDMLVRISKLFDVPLNKILACKMTENNIEEIKELASNVEKYKRKHKLKLIKILIASATIITFLCSMIFFVNTYNKYKIYNVGILSDSIYCDTGIFINTNDKDILYFGKLRFDDNIIDYESQADIYIIKDKKEIVLSHINDLSKSIELDLSKTNFKITKLEDYFNNIYIKAYTKKENGSEEVLKGKIYFVLRFKNSKLFYKHTNNNKEKVKAHNKSTAEIKNNLKQMNFKENSKNIFVNKEKHITFLLNEKELRYSFFNKKSNIHYKYIYYNDSNSIQILIIDKSEKINSIIEDYKYYITDSEVECLTGRCQNYKEVFKFLKPYLDALF